MSTLTLYDRLPWLCVSHHARRRCHRCTDIWYFLTLPLSRCPCTVLTPLSVIINFWLVQLVTVSAFQDNWQFWVSQVWRACLCCRNHWTVKLSEWITPGSTDRELGVRWDGRRRSDRRSCIHRIMKGMLRTYDAESMFGIHQSHLIEMIENANSWLTLTFFLPIRCFFSQMNALF